MLIVPFGRVLAAIVGKAWGVASVPEYSSGLLRCIQARDRPRNIDWGEDVVLLRGGIERVEVMTGTSQGLVRSPEERGRRHFVFLACDAQNAGAPGAKVVL